MKSKPITILIMSSLFLAIMLTLLVFIKDKKHKNNSIFNDSLVSIQKEDDSINKSIDVHVASIDSAFLKDSAIKKAPSAYKSSSRQKTYNINVEQLMHYAESLIGKPYMYACSDPEIGFDCSGFVSHVFGHFGIDLPHSSQDYMNIGKAISPEKAKPGDIILFTGTTNFNKNLVGHVGIVYQNTDTLRFIHSSSGKKMGVTITPLSKGYEKRFIKIIRILLS